MGKLQEERDSILQGWVFVILGIVTLAAAAALFAGFGNLSKWIVPLSVIAIIFSCAGFGYGINTCGKQRYGHGTWMIVFSALTIMACLALIGWIIVNKYFILTAKVR